MQILLVRFNDMHKPPKPLPSIQLSDEQLGGLVNALVEYTTGAKLAGSTPDSERESLRTLLKQICSHDEELPR